MVTRQRLAEKPRVFAARIDGSLVSGKIRDYHLSRLCPRRTRPAESAAEDVMMLDALKSE